jgi:hypothetical protein
MSHLAWPERGLNSATTGQLSRQKASKSLGGGRVKNHRGTEGTEKDSVPARISLIHIQIGCGTVLLQEGQLPAGNLACATAE